MVGLEKVVGEMDVQVCAGNVGHLLIRRAVGVGWLGWLGAKVPCLSRYSFARLPLRRSVCARLSWLAGVHAQLPSDRP